MLHLPKATPRSVRSGAQSGRSAVHVGYDAKAKVDGRPPTFEVLRLKNSGLKLLRMGKKPALRTHLGLPKILSVRILDAEAAIHLNS